ncbi:serine hydrolase domain-containing protein [Aliikangiella sp. IMCC44359]|uniref:serine hydrolase domain-containing protein n=1 Tax=Aliikangiella sp. IMCC44359 TaxID=3459125 RepID=UPI00403A9F40
MRLSIFIWGVLLSFNIHAQSKTALLKQADIAIRQSQYTGIDAFIVYQNGQFLTENYYAQFDEKTPHRTHSTFKSITALIALIAVEQKLISLEQPVIPLLEEFRKLEDKDPRKRQITIEHLFNMTSGLACDESPDSNGPNHEFGIDEGKTPLAYAMEIKMATTPGTQWNYCNANSFMLAAAVSAALQRANRENIFLFAELYLLKALGITNYRLTKSDDGRFLNGQGNAYFLPKDLVKIGQLLLQNGKWQGASVVTKRSSSLVNKNGHNINWSFTDFLKDMPSTKTTYSFQWYKTQFNVKDKPIDVLHSWGNGGQFIYVIPQLEAVIVLTGSNQGNFAKQKQPFEILYQYVLPALMKKK